MRDGRHTSEPIVPFKPAESTRVWVRLTTDIEDHEEADAVQPEKFPAGRWAKAKVVIWEDGGRAVKGDEFPVWDPWENEDDGYRNVEGDYAKAEYMRGPNRWEIYDAPTRCEGDA